LYIIIFFFSLIINVIYFLFFFNRFLRLFLNRRSNWFGNFNNLLDGSFS
jgi:hypothetical protein